jgi:hypothetical protein
MIRFPDSVGAAARSQALVTPADLGPSLLDWWGLCEDESPDKECFTARSLLPLVRGESETVRDRICIAGSEEDCDKRSRAIRVPAWYLRMGDSDSLYAKPDDRWEANDVADRCHEVVEKLQNVVDEFERQVQAEEPVELTPLDDVLIHGLE